MAEADAVAEGLNAEFDSIQETRRRIEQSDSPPAVRAGLLAELARREADHARRLAEYDAQTRPPVGQEPALVQAREAQRESAATASSVASGMRAKLPAGDPRAEGAAYNAAAQAGEVAPSGVAPEQVSFSSSPLPTRSPEEDAAVLTERRTELERTRQALQQIESLPMQVGQGVAGNAQFREDAARRLRIRASELEQEVRIREEDYDRRLSGASPTSTTPVPVGQGFTMSTPVDSVTPVPVGPPGAPRAGTEQPAAGTPQAGGRAGAGGARGGAGGRPQTLSAAEQLLASLQSGTPDEQDRLLQNLVDSYRREATTRQDFGDQGSVVVDEGLLAQEELALARQEEFQQELIDQERRLQEIDTALGVLSSTRFDANRLFTDRGLATSMALGVAVNAATSLAQNALFPGANAGNTALQIVNGAIERDIQTQMVNFERGVQSVQGMRTAYEMARNLSGDRQAAYEFATAVSQRRVGEQLRSMAMQTQGLVAREQLMRQADDLLLQAAQREEMARMQMAQAMMAARPRGGSGGARTAGDGTGRAFAPFAVRTARAAGLTRAEIVKALNPTTVSRLEEGLNGTAEALDILDEIQNQLGTYSSWSLVDRAVMSQLISSYQNAFRQASGMGALDQGALTLMEKILANPNDVTTPISSFRAQLRSARARLVRTARRQVNTLGDGLIEWDPRSDPTGATVSGGGNELGEGATVVGEPTAGSENTMAGVLGQAGVEGTLRAADTAIAESTDPTATVVRGFTQAVAPGAFRGN